MGEKVTRLAALKRKSPKCCFCAGGRETATIEHAPPKVFFRNKLRWRGLEFPACVRCNNGSSHRDQVASLIMLLGGWVFDTGIVSDDYVMKLVRGVRNNNPEVLQCFDLDGAEDGLVRIKGLLHPIKKVNIDAQLIRNWINPWIAKTTCALWFHHTGRILSEDQRIFVKFMTNAAVLQGGLPKSILRETRHTCALTQGRLNSADQFLYQFNVSPDHGLGLFVFVLHRASFAIAGVIKEDDLDALASPPKRGELYRTTPELGVSPCDVPAFAGNST